MEFIFGDCVVGNDDLGLEDAILAEEQSRPTLVRQPQTGCPQGCTAPKAGCDIKGNIGFDTGEKIYHLPGQKYYPATVIDPRYGERWFCTEQEAVVNGWRKSRQ